jgi:hypothetical protein
MIFKEDVETPPPPHYYELTTTLVLIVSKGLQFMTNREQTETKFKISLGSFSSQLTNSFSDHGTNINNRQYKWRLLRGGRLITMAGKERMECHQTHRKWCLIPFQSSPIKVPPTS